jgi:tetratricopeptide (TPR) repeat protein
MYFATFTLGTIREQSGNMGLAEKSFLQALKLKEKYLPNESAAPCYLGLCETSLHRKDYEEVKEYARKALEEPYCVTIWALRERRQRPSTRQWKNLWVVPSPATT